MQEEDVKIIMQNLVQWAECTACNCSKCKEPKKVVTIACFENHPGWVNISPHSIEKVLREYEVSADSFHS